MMKKLALCALVAALVSAPALALDNPIQSRYDHRIRYVTYNPADVVQVNTVIGVATHITLERGEEYLTHAFGDSDAYEFAHKANHLFFKPKAEMADTNLIVVTDRRTYNFRLSFQSTRASAIYEISFRYPDTASRVAREAAEKAKVDESFKMRPGLANLRYTMSGDMEVAPINAWDDGRFTYFKFAANADMPAVYMVDGDDNETLVNTTPKGKANEILMVQKVNPKFRLRLGDRVISVWNDGYDAKGIQNTTGTASPRVERVIKGGL